MDKREEGRNAKASRHVAVIVMGDVGRSPRMQYHAQSLLQEGFTVSLIGYKGEQLVPALKEPNDRLFVIRFSTSSPKFLRKVLPVYYIWRLCSLLCGLAWAMWVSLPDSPPVDCLLVQNPPAVPLLAFSYLFCISQRVWKRYKTALVIDWHNLGYSMLRQEGGIIHFLARRYEQHMAALANGHLCVTKAMKDYLGNEIGVEENVKVLYDCPPAMFRPLSLTERHEFLLRMGSALCAKCPRSWHRGLDASRRTLFTENDASSGTICMRKGRPALVTSSTSWTEDEDFGLLLDALVLLDRALSAQSSPLNILVAVTGKGPMKDMYEKMISKLSLIHVAVVTLWLEPGDYPKLLACADVGISLHTSTSGLDLPMKILDLFGCHVPVLALNFDCLSELVKDGVNGRVFGSSAELAEQLEVLLAPITESSVSTNNDLNELSRSLQDRKRWSENWRINALPVLVEAMASA